MTVISGKLYEVVDLKSFALLPNNHGTDSIAHYDGYKVQLIARTRKPVKTTLKSGYVIEIDEGPLTTQTFDALFNRQFSEFDIKLPTPDYEEAQDLQLVVRDSDGKLVFRSERVRPNGAPAEPISIFMIHDVLAKVGLLRTEIQDLINVDPFAGIDIPSDFDSHFFEGVAKANLDATTEFFVDLIESGDFPGIGKEKVATTDSEIEISGNTFDMTFEFYKNTKQMVRTNSGGPAMVPKKRFLTLSVEGRVLVTKSVDPNRYATADLLDIDVKSKKALVIIGAPFASNESLMPAGTVNAVSNGLDASISPLVDQLSTAMTQLSTQHVLLGHLSGYFAHGVTATLTGFDTAPHPATRKPQLRPIATIGFPADPFAG